MSFPLFYVVLRFPVLHSKYILRMIGVAKVIDIGTYTVVNGIIISLFWEIRIKDRFTLQL